MIAFTYPGQGSQVPAMGAAWVNHPSWELTNEISEATGRDVAQLLLEADADELKQTRNSQLASFTMSMVVLDAITLVGVFPNCHAGHSLGEFSALAASGVLSLSDAAQLVGERGEAMQMASEEQPGTMAAVLGLGDEKVEELCAAASSTAKVWVANYNAPGQVVIAGTQEGIDEVAKLATEAGGKKTMALKVGGAFHTPFMESARERLDKALDKIDFRNPDSPVYANVDAKPYDHSMPFKNLISSQLTSPVMWHSILKQMSADGITQLVEMGSGKALTAMAKRVEGANFELSVVNNPNDIDALFETLGHPKKSLMTDDGEHLYATERLVVSPRGGVFNQLKDLAVGSEVSIGETIGVVSDEAVKSPFAGTIMGYLAETDERIDMNQPLVWLQTNN